MSRKPLKKTDQSKSWMRKRGKVIPAPPEYHLIVCEGTKTEPNYFEGLKREIYQQYGKYSKGRINIKIEGGARNTLSLLDYTINLVNKDPNPIRHVWLVYDQDDFPKDDFDNTAYKCEALSETNKSINRDTFVTYHALWSNQCIELWFLLHFSFYQTDGDRSAYKPLIDRYLGSIGSTEYTKNRADIYDILRDYMGVAISNAKKLEKEHGNNVPSKNKPGTRVYMIFDVLSAYLK